MWINHSIQNKKSKFLKERSCKIDLRKIDLLYQRINNFFFIKKNQKMSFTHSFYIYQNFLQQVSPTYVNAAIESKILFSIIEIDIFISKFNILQRSFAKQQNLLIRFSLFHWTRIWIHWTETNITLFYLLYSL